jgi:hypothetical protein
MFYDLEQREKFIYDTSLAFRSKSLNNVWHSPLNTATISEAQ